MESLIKKSFLSLIVMLLLVLAIPVMVNAAEAPLYTISDMKLNKIIYFEGQTYSSLNYSCNDKYALEKFDTKTAGIVWKINRKYNSIVVQLSNGRFRTIKVSNVVEIREKDFISFKASSLEETLNGDLKLNITIAGEENAIELSNKAVVNLNTDGSLSLTANNGESLVRITKKGQEDKPVEFYIIKNAEGKVILDIDDKYISADAKAQICQAITAGADAKIALEDGVIVLAANAKVDNVDESQTYVGAGAALSYDTKQDINNEETDIKADVHAEVLGHEVSKTNINTRVIKTIKTILQKLRSLR